MTSRLAVVAVLAVASPVSAIAASTKDPDVPFVKYSLDNGLEVILHQDRAVPLVHVDVWYHVGSGDEDPGKTGFAHLFEHMMFQGTKDTGEDRHFAILREIGGKDENGTTNTDRTNYFETVPSHQLETALWLESERMGYLLGAVTGKSLDNQKEVVRNERRQNYDNVPFGKDRFATAAMLYPEGHPLRYLTIGRHEDVDGAKLADVRSFFKKWYRPSNATLCLAGDFEMDQAKALVKKWFGSFPKLDRPEQRELDPSKEKIQTAHVELRDGLAKLRRVHFVWHSPANFAPGDAALDVASDALGAEGTGRLSRRLVIEKRLCRTVRVFQGSQQRTSAFHVIGDLLDDAKIADVEAIVDEEIARLLKEGISDAELKRAVTRRESDYVWQLEGLHERAEVLQAYNHYLGDPGRIGWDLERYRKLTPADVKAAAASYLASDRRGEIVTMPATGAQQDPSVLAPQPASTPAPESDPPEPGLTFAEEPFRATRPAAATARALEPPKVERFTMGDGIEVYLVERHQLPVVAMDLVVDGGRVSEPKGKEGLADLAANLLDDGTQKLGKVAFEEAQGDLGSTIGASADDEEMSLRLATLKKNLEPTLDLFADTVLSPGLRAEDHERNVKQAIAALRQSKGSPAALSRRLVPAMLHGPTHALGRIRTEASLESVTLDDVRSFVSSSWKPHGARLFVMGDVTRGEIEKLAGKRLASFKGTAAAIPKLAPFEPMAPRIVFVDVPGASQSVIVLGEPGPPRQASDHVATRLAMNVLGGDFTSRINMNLREDKGWAYGAYAGIAYSKTLGTFQASASVKTDATRDAVLELLKEVKGVASGDVKEEEVTREKDAAILGLPGRFATGSEIIATFRGLAFFGLPLDYYATFAGKVKATTRDDAGKAARAHLDPGALRLLVVGDGARVLPGLKELAATQALGPGELALLDADGAPVEP